MKNFNNKSPKEVLEIVKKGLADPVSIETAEIEELLFLYSEEKLDDSEKGNVDYLIANNGEVRNIWADIREYIREMESPECTKWLAGSKKKVLSNLFGSQLAEELIRGDDLAPSSVVKNVVPYEQAVRFDKIAADSNLHKVPDVWFRVCGGEFDGVLLLVSVISEEGSVAVSVFDEKYDESFDLDGGMIESCNEEYELSKGVAMIPHGGGDFEFVVRDKNGQEILLEFPGVH